MTTILGILIVFGLIILAVSIWKKSRFLSICLTVPVFFVLFIIGYVVFNSWYHTTSESLEISVEREKQRYSLSGVWVKPMDNYRFVTDYIVFYVPDNIKLSNVKRNRYKDYNEMDYKGLEAAVHKSLNEIDPPKLQPQFFDIETTKEFRISFDFPENINPSDIKVYYVHIREEPMDSLEFWFKEIDLK